jgi:hypothetical protein
VPGRETAPGFFVLLQDEGETDEIVQARIRAKIARGDASPHDRFVTFFWKPLDDDEG